MITSLGAQVTLCDSIGGEVGSILASLLAVDGITVRGVHVVKVSHEELVADGRVPDDTDESLIAAVHELRADGAGTALGSRADRGALALIDDHLYTRFQCLPSGCG